MGPALHDHLPEAVTIASGLNSGSAAARAAGRLIRGARDAWLIFGLALALLLAGEGLYRLQLGARERLRAAPPAVPASHPYAGQAWFAELSTALDRRRTVFDPYRAFTLQPMTSPYLNIDSAGHRLTPQPERPHARAVLLFGGSAMWGLTVRDSGTIAALLVDELDRRGIRDVRVVNLAQPGYNTTQELATLILELANGRVPAAAVFMDGYNDVAIAMNTGVVGRVFAQAEAGRIFERGRRGFPAELFGLGRHSALIQRLGMAVGPAQPAASRGSESLCPEVAAFYAANARDVQGIARAWGFPALGFLQPHNAASAKPLSPWEATLPRDPTLARCLTAIATAMAPESGRSFFDLRGAFDTDTVTRFVDRHSHVTEDADRLIAALIADRLAPLLDASHPAPGRAQPGR